MRIVGYSLKNPRPALAAARAVLARGGVIAYPTETSYGLGADPLHLSAVEGIYKMKARDKKLFLPLVASSLAMIEAWCVLSPPARRLARGLWPGPFTMILPLKRDTAGQKKLARYLRTREIAVRISGHPLPRQLARLTGHPFISTSANISARPAAFSAQDVQHIFARCHFQPDIIIDGGSLRSRRPSTIVRIDEKGILHLVRPGVVSFQRIQSFL